MTKIQIDVLSKTYRNSIEYSLEKSAVHNTQYTANCIEHGDKFESDFYAPSTYTKAQLDEIGQDMAMGWGGECASVRKTLSEQDKFNKACKKFGYTPQDYNKELTLKTGKYSLVGFTGTTKILVKKGNEYYELKLTRGK